MNKMGKIIKVVFCIFLFLFINLIVALNIVLLNLPNGDGSAGFTWIQLFIFILVWIMPTTVFNLFLNKWAYKTHSNKGIYATSKILSYVLLVIYICIVIYTGYIKL